MHRTWIWLPKDIYPKDQTTRFDNLSEGENNNYVVAEFKKEYCFEQKVSSVLIQFSADTEVQLFCNGSFIAMGPPTVGGDFLGNGKPREWYYGSETVFEADSERLEFFARVKMCPTRICEFSKGHGGFMLSATVNFFDGTSLEISSDNSWLVRRNGAYFGPCAYDGRIEPTPFTNAEIIEDIWSVDIAPIPPRCEKEIEAGRVQLKAHEEITRELSLDMIYAGFIHIVSRAEGAVSLTLNLLEENETAFHQEYAVLSCNDEYRSFHLDSVGKIVATLKNESDQIAYIDIGFITTCYPIEVEANTVTDDEKINEVLSVCKHTLKYCRQTHHLDSPRHCEPLACTGDYYIESLMTSFSFGDMRLAEFDVDRTAQLLRHNGGRMFHTTYSLIWVRMLYDVYMIGGNYSLLGQCRDALDMLLALFDTYIGENGLIENPPDYMFVDWIYIDGLSLHHPPKALGQTALNMFYYMALDYAERIYMLLNDTDAALKANIKKKALQAAVNSLLYDSERGVYFEGLNTPIREEQICHFQAQNVEKRYYLKHSNILAAYTSICDGNTARKLIEKVMNDTLEGVVQPYFMHYLLEAIFTHGLREKYTLQVIELWKPAVEICKKGLVEGFYAPEPTYSFDHSHAWGGTPLYSLPKALTGLTIEEAGYKKIKLSPSLIGLNEAKIEIPTPYGMIECHLKRGEAPRINAPEEIRIDMEI